VKATITRRGGFQQQHKR